MPARTRGVALEREYIHLLKAAGDASAIEALSVVYDKGASPAVARGMVARGSRGSMSTHRSARRDVGVHREKNQFAVRFGGQQHSFRCLSAQFGGFEIGHHDDEPSQELLRSVVLGDAGHNLPPLASQFNL